MASSDGPDHVPRYGGFTRFELELEVRPNQVHVPPLFITNLPLVRAVPRQSRLSQLPSPAEDP